MGKLFAVYEIQDKRQRIANGHVSMVLERYGRRWMIRPLDLYTMEGGNPRSMIKILQEGKFICYGTLFIKLI
jgi:hypothetical protein